MKTKWMFGIEDLIQNELFGIKYWAQKFEMYSEKKK